MAYKHTLTRCPWPTPGDSLYIAYHDHEWGKPIFDDKRIYEFLVLEVFQAGLSWRTVLHKREAFRSAFAGFDFNKIARFNSREIRGLLSDKEIIRNRLKIEAVISNAREFIKIRKEFGTFSRYMWNWVGGKPIDHKLKTGKDYPVFTEEAVSWSKDLKKRGFKFLGPTVIYSHMQAVGMVNDHLISCFRHARVKLA